MSLQKCITKWCRGKRRPNGNKCNKCSMAQWRQRHPVKAKLAILRDRAKKKRVPFDLDAFWLSEFLFASFYDPKIHHIDRIIPAKGYTKGNLQVLNGSENIAKGNKERHDCPF